jgi:cysteine desulfurase
MSEVATPVYLDHNATTPVDPRVLEAMLPFFTDVFGNPSSVEHLHGNRAQAAVGRARAQIASALGARDNEIIFTGSCTEANNIAILGAARARPERRHLITSAVEHPSVLEPFRQLHREGYEVVFVGVDEQGQVSAGEVAALMRPDTGLVSIMGANNEVGTLQPIGEIATICEEREVLFHTDLAQVLAHRPLDVTNEHIHLASLSAHKAYGPKGIGALYVRSRSPRARVVPILFGGGQERALRPGTLNVPLMVGFARALEITAQDSKSEGVRLRTLCAEFRRRVSDMIADVQFNGHPTQRLPNNISMSIPGIEPLALIRRLNHVASFSASSACATEKVQTSPVLLAMFGDTARARQAFRVSPGRTTTGDQLLGFANALTSAAADLRRFAA